MQASRPRLPGQSHSPYGGQQGAASSSQQQQQQLYPSLPAMSSSSAVGFASSAGASTSVQQQQQQGEHEDPTYGPLERAAKVVSDRLGRDALLVGELGDGLQGTSSSAYTFPPSANFSPFVKRKMFPIPDALFAEFESIDHRSILGIFPEIDRVWTTIDNKLFLWDFQDTADLMTHEEQSEILHVGLVRSKSSVFVDSIPYVLVICMERSIHLLGLSTSQVAGRKSTDLTFHETEFMIPTDGITMSAVCSTPSGRTFMCGSDGNLHELIYRTDEGWFTKRTGIVNWTGGGGGLGIFAQFVPLQLKGKTEDKIVDLALDPSRSVLYALTANSCIELFMIGPTDQLTRIAKVADVGRSAMMLAPGAQGLLEPRSFAIMSLSPVGRAEGDTGAQMVAVTSKGVRLYFSYYRRGYGGIRNSSGPPTGLELIHVRLPPTNLTLDGPASTPGQQGAPSAVSGPSYSNGFGSDQHYRNQQLVPAQQQQQQQSAAAPIRFNKISSGAVVRAGAMVAPQLTAADNVDILLLTCPDLGYLSQPVPQAPAAPSYGSSSAVQQQQQQPSRPPLVELCQALAIEGQTWRVAEVPHPLSDLTYPTPASLRVPGRGELRLNELAASAEAGPRTFLVLTSEGMHVIEKRTPADVLRAILEASGGGSQGEVAAFFSSYGRDEACALCLALASGADAALASQTSASQRLTSSLGQPASADASLAAKRLFYEFGGRPVRIERGYGQLGQTTSQMFFSGRHEALVRVLARALRPLWGQRVTAQLVSGGQTSNVSEPTLVTVQRELTALKTFLDCNIQLFTTGPAVDQAAGERSSEAQAWKVEQSSLAALVGLVVQAIEAVSFILLLIDYKLPEILAQCSSELQQSMLNLTYEDLLTTAKGREVARSVVNAVMNQQISQQTSIDAISDVLQQRCGSFCRTDDVVLFKALEGIRKAKESRDPHERNECLRESLRLFVKGTAHLSLQQLKDACEEYRSLQFPTGAIELPLRCAQEWDAAGLGVEFLEDGSPQGDPRQAAYERRQQCYECVFETLLAFDRLLDDESAGRQPKSTGLGNDAETLRANAYNQALSSTDPLFHHSLYDWLAERRLTDQLLEIRTPFIEQYLSSEPLSHSRAELLWQYYVRNGHYAQAAVVQANLAQSTELELPLPQRLEYLTLAVANAKSSSSAHDGAMSVEFRTDIEEKLDVAQVQIEICRTVYESDELADDLRTELVRQLNQRLLTISELYLDFAQPYELLEATLLILHTSDHRDPDLVSEMWNAIIRKICASSGEACVPVIAAKVADLGRRFYPSETAFPLEFLARRLEAFAWDQRATSSSAGWVPLALRQAGVDWERIFDVFFATFDEKDEPWDSIEGARFLANDIGVLLSKWLEDWSRSQSGYGPRSVSRFPALQIEEFVNNALLPLFVSDAEGDERKARLRALKRAIMASM